MGELFDFNYPFGNTGSIIEIEIDGFPWAYSMPGIPREENRFITYGHDFKADHEYRIIEVDGREMAERIK